MRLPPAQDAQLWNQARLDPVGNQVSQLLLQQRRVRHADDLTGSVGHPDQHRPTRAIGKSDEGANHLVRRGQFPLGTPASCLLVSLNTPERRAWSEIYSEAPGSSMPPSRD